MILTPQFQEQFCSSFSRTYRYIHAPVLCLFFLNSYILFLSCTKPRY